MALSLAVQEGVTDLQVTVCGEAGTHGFGGTALGGAELSVVHDAGVASRMPDLASGDVVRLVDAVRRKGGAEIEIRPWTEVYGVRSETAPA